MSGDVGPHVNVGFKIIDGWTAAKKGFSQSNRSDFDASWFDRRRLIQVARHDFCAASTQINHRVRGVVDWKAQKCTLPGQLGLLETADDTHSDAGFGCDTGKELWRVGCAS